MELRHFRYFQAVAERLSFSRASERLHIAQPALSRAVREMEEELGVTLLERTERPVRLTEAGLVLLRECGIFLEQFEDIQRKVRRAGQGEGGELRLGYIGPPTLDFMGSLLREFRKRCPRVSLQLQERTPERVWEMVERGTLSVGLTRPVPAQDSLRLSTLTLCLEELCAVLPIDHKWAVADSVPWTCLADEAILLLARREGASLYDEIHRACTQAGFSPRIAQTPSLVGTVLRYTEAGVGVGIVPESAARSFSSGTLKKMRLTPIRKVPLVLVWGKSDDFPMREFVALIKEWSAAGRFGSNTDDLCSKKES